MASVLASWPAASAKRRTFSGGTTTTGKPLAMAALTKACSSRPVASTTMRSRPVSGEAFEERCDRLFVVGNAEREVSFEQVEVEVVFADIDTGIDGEKLLGHGYSVLLNSGS